MRDENWVRGPTELDGPVDQSVLAVGGFPVLGDLRSCSRSARNRCDGKAARSLPSRGTQPTPLRSPFRGMALRSQDVPFSSDRILFSVDSPYGRMTELAPWFDSCPISEIDRQKIGRDNARSLFKLDTPAHR